MKSNEIGIIYSPTFTKYQKLILLIIVCYVPTILTMIFLPKIIKYLGSGDVTFEMNFWILWFIRVVIFALTAVVVKLRLKVWVSNDDSKRRNSINLIIQREIEATNAKTQNKKINNFLRECTLKYIDGEIDYIELFNLIEREY